MTNLTAQKIDTEKLAEVFVLKTQENRNKEYEFSYNQDELIQRLEDIACSCNDNMVHYNDDNYNDMEDPEAYSIPGVYDTSTGELKYGEGDTEFEHGSTYYDVLNANDVLEYLDPEAAAEFIEQLETEMREKFTIELD